MMKCPTCGAENADGSQFCTTCGAPLSDEGAQHGVGELPSGPMVVGPTNANASTPPAQPGTPAEPSGPVGPSPATPPPPPPAQPIIPPPAYTNQPGMYSGPQVSGPKSNNALLALIFGIVSVVVCCSGIIMGPLAIYFALQARKELNTEQGMATAGLVLGIIGTVSGVGAIIYYIVVIAFAAHSGAFSPFHP